MAARGKGPGATAGEGIQCAPLIQPGEWGGAVSAKKPRETYCVVTLGKTVYVSW